MENQEKHPKHWILQHRLKEIRYRMLTRSERSELPETSPLVDLDTVEKVRFKDVIIDGKVEWKTELVAKTEVP